MKDIWNKIFGIGLGKTGTTSLTKAMEILEFTPVAHGLKYIDELRDVRFAADIFIAARWQFLDYAYPKAKFILTDRNTDSWINSTCRHYESTQRRNMEGAPTEWGLKIPLRTAESRWLLYGTTVFDPENFKNIMNYHRAKIEQYFKDESNKLLVIDFEKGAGWHELCKFLDVPVPNVLFPHKNKK